VRYNPSVAKGCHTCAHPFSTKTCISLIIQCAPSLWWFSSNPFRCISSRHARSLQFTTHRSINLRGNPVHRANLLLQSPLTFSDLLGHIPVCGFTILFASGLYDTRTFGLSQTPCVLVNSLSVWMRQHSDPSKW
jgi:hypothetical protein